MKTIGATRRAVPRGHSGEFETHLALESIDSRSGLSCRVVRMPPGVESWYRANFASDLYRPSRSWPDAECIYDRARSHVYRLPAGLSPPRPVEPDLDGDPADVRAVDRLIVKEEVFPIPSNRLFTRPRSQREFCNLRHLRAIGLPAVEPICFGYEGFTGFYSRVFTMTVEFSDSMTLKEWVSDRRDPRRRDVARDVGAYTCDRQGVFRALSSLAPRLAAAHRRGCYLRTLYAKNVLIRPCGTEVELALCDTPRVWQSRQRRFYFTPACFDLATLDKCLRRVFGESEREHLFDRYLSALGEGPSRVMWMRRLRLMSSYLGYRSPVGRMKEVVRRSCRAVRRGFGGRA